MQMTHITGYYAIACAGCLSKIVVGNRSRSLAAETGCGSSSCETTVQKVQNLGRPAGRPTVANIQARVDSRGQVRYRVQIHLKGYPPQTATFDRKTDAKEWVRHSEADMKAGRHFKVLEAKRHTVAQVIDRYLRDVMPGKKRNSQAVQTSQLLWWKKRLGRYLLADVTPALIAEARALIGFAGARVRDTIREQLPDGFQRAEFLLAHGFVDRVVDRRQLKGEIARILSLLMAVTEAAQP